MSDNSAKKRISVTVSGLYFELLERLVGKGFYVDKSEAIKDALRRLFRHYEMEPFASPLEETEES